MVVNDAASLGFEAQEQNRLATESAQRVIDRARTSSAGFPRQPVTASSAKQVAHLSEVEAVEDLVRLRSVPIVLWTSVAQTFTNLTEPEQLFAQAATKRWDLSGFEEARVHVTQNAAASVNTKVRVKYATSSPTSIGSYSPLGASSTEVEVSATTSGGVNLLSSSWIDLTASAKTDVYLTAALQGGDSAADPIFSSVTLEVR